MQGDQPLWLVAVGLIPIPRGTDIVSAPVPKKPLMMVGIDGGDPSARDCTVVQGNFTNAPSNAISKA